MSLKQIIIAILIGFGAVLSSCAHAVYVGPHLDFPKNTVMDDN
jgi:hypothetical protein